MVYAPLLSNHSPGLDTFGPVSAPGFAMLEPAGVARFVFAT